MKDSEVHTAVVAWLASLAGVTVVKAYEGGDAPELPYIAVSLTGVAEVRENAQFDEYDPDLPKASSTEVLASEDDLDASLVFDDSGQGDVTAKPQIETEWRFSVHAYGAHRINPKTDAVVSPRPLTPTDILRPIRAAAQLVQKNEPLMPGLIVHEVSAIRNVPEFVNARWEPRAQMDLFIRGIVADGFVIDVIAYTSFDISPN